MIFKPSYRSKSTFVRWTTDIDQIFISTLKDIFFVRLKTYPISTVVPSSVHVSCDERLQYEKGTQILIRSSFRENCYARRHIWAKSLEGRPLAQGVTADWVWLGIKIILALRNVIRIEAAYMGHQPFLSTQNFILKFSTIQAKHGFVLSQIWKAKLIFSPNNYK